MKREPAEVTQRLDQTFRGPTRARTLIGALRSLPPSVAREVLAAVAIGDGLIRQQRFIRAARWAAATGLTGWPRYRLAFALLANHGRFIAQEAMLGLSSAADLRSSTEVIGIERVPPVGRGAILLGMHVGPPRGWLALRAAGYPVRFVGRGEAGEGRLWDDWQQQGVVIPMPSGDVTARLRGLYRIRRLLAAGELVFITADGPLGSQLFQLDVPGAPIIRQGWFGLRRQLNVPTLPLTVHATDGGRRVVTIHPPLPAVDAEAGRDADACRTALTSIMQDYIRRFPSQCRYLAFPDWV